MVPIALFVYNRPNHTKKTIEFLLKNTGIEKTDLYVFSDGPKCDKEVQKVDDVRKIVRGIKGFNKIEIIEHLSNSGLANNIIDGVSHVFKSHDSIIVLEDDLLVSSGFIEYIIYTLCYYKNAPVTSISAYSPPLSIPKNYQYSTFFMPRICSWGWATWKNKWLEVDWNISDFDDFITDKKQRLRFQRGGNDTSVMLLKQKLGLINSWAIRFNYFCFKKGEYCVYPIKSLVSNIGVDGSGTHMGSNSKYNVSIAESVSIKNLCSHEKQSTNIQNSFRKFYNPSIYRKAINMYKIWKYKRNIQ